ncbi:bacilysin biosynthesis oxidoreductase YwfH [Variibacter gotjawalensis]|uniref:Bacilysin biosynthesis oxidoreductase YwfH n=1 Tax=Variibacter gotjawalensis TaxID=1333996 RepID=A0A0S3PQZ4_9BRAD|nr:SDR family oxidoreductase [Variibacter gotjawalensis]NIK48684.1 NAD(P)-dependent dehydrogenase (short-subunit alcohol dehydrogenase family) [Variibacter gotjawalensis]RZS50545.1 3-oxoacyl-[acyl-carrier protein] reductase [Variibacter gotjawalensis]BAT58379.1 bacilysin biosynthesis oxidoreductase YwfH [Variibacter gotjawalensis]
MAEDFKEKIVVVTGGSRGIGRGIANAFARAGAQTVLVAATQKNLDAAADAIAAEGHLKPLVSAGDLGSLKSCEAAFALVKEKFGRCDILVNSAGATKAGSFVDQPDEDWIAGFNGKYFAAVRMSRLFWPMLVAAKGSLVNIAGVAGRQPDPNFLVGGSANAAMINFSKGLAGQGKKDDVNVNVILPGITETDRVMDLMKQRAAALNISMDEARKQTLTKGNIRRIGTVEDIAALALFLCSPAARHIQGTQITVDGGATDAMS